MPKEYKFDMMKFENDLVKLTKKYLPKVEMTNIVTDRLSAIGTIFCAGVEDVAKLLTNKRSNNLSWYDVYLNGVYIDSIPSQYRYSANDMRDILVYHDNYDPKIEVRWVL